MLATVKAPTMPWLQARALAHQLAVPLPAEQVALPAAAGRTLAAAVLAAVALPTCDNAAMDGYAVRGPGPWRVTRRLLAGQLAGHALRDGEAVEIATGAAVPAGTWRVVRYEACQRDGEVLHAAGEERDHIRRAGEFVRAQQPVLGPGEVLGPAALGLAASAGADAVRVRRRATVRILVTGDEVVCSGAPRPGQVRDAIGPVLEALLPAWGAGVDAILTVHDDLAAVTRAIGASLSTVDVTVVCGSSSVGPADHLHRAASELDGEVHVDGVACRPGHPQLLARAGTGWLVGLPGNPFAALVAAHTILHPLLLGLAGRPLPELPHAVMVGEVPPDARHTRLVPVRWQGGAVRVVKGARPGHLGAAAHADALAVVAPGPRRGGTVALLGLAGV